MFKKKCCDIRLDFKFIKFENYAILIFNFIINMQSHAKISRFFLTPNDQKAQFICHKILLSSAYFTSRLPSEPDLMTIFIYFSQCLQFIQKLKSGIFTTSDLHFTFLSVFMHFYVARDTK